MSGLDHKEGSEPDIGTFLLASTLLFSIRRDGVCLKIFIKEVRPRIPDKHVTGRFPRHSNGLVSSVHLGLNGSNQWVVLALCQWSFRQRISQFQWIHCPSGLALCMQISWWMFLLFSQYFFLCYMIFLACFSYVCLINPAWTTLSLLQNHFTNYGYGNAKCGCA